MHGIENDGGRAAAVVGGTSQKKQFGEKDFHVVLQQASWG